MIQGQEEDDLLANHKCDVDTFLDNTTETCRCNRTMVLRESLAGQDDPDRIDLASLFDWNLVWGRELIEFCTELANGHGTIDGIESNDDYHDNTTVVESWTNLTSPTTRINMDIRDTKCDETAAARAYWNVRTDNNNRPSHGIVGARCSGASIALARLADLEGVPQVSWSMATELSDKERFPYFNRVVPPDNEFGEVGGLIALARAFGWDRVSILNTEMAYSSGFATSFRKLWVGDHYEDDSNVTWTGEIAYSDTIRIQTNGKVDQDSVRQSLQSVPTDDPEVNSRIIVLVAHRERAFPILKIAAEMNFQPDTIWLGPSAWAGRVPLDGDYSWMSTYPGYFGTAPYRNRDEHYYNFLNVLQLWQRMKDKPEWEDLPPYAAEVVDSMATLLRVLGPLSAEQRRDVNLVTSSIRALDFNGVTGRVQFTDKGNRKDAKISILNYQRQNVASTASPSFSRRSLSHHEGEWITVGVTSMGKATIDLEKSCFPLIGCDLDKPPLDSYPVPGFADSLPTWIIPVLIIPVILCMGITVKYWRSHRSKKRLKTELDAFRESMVGMRTAEITYVPFTPALESAVSDANKTMLKAGNQPCTKVQWCWQETPGFIDRHDPDDIVGDPAEYWVKYDPKSNVDLEAAYKRQQKSGVVTLITGYMVDFDTMLQTKQSTGFQRHVKRVVESAQPEEAPTEIDLNQIRKGDALPDDLSGEPQMVLVEGDIVQISSQRQDSWAFGTKVGVDLMIIRTRIRR